MAAGLWVQTAVRGRYSCDVRCKGYLIRPIGGSWVELGRLKGYLKLPTE